MKLSLENSYWETIVGNLLKGSQQLVIVCHGRCCTKEEYFIPALSQAVHAAWYSCFAFDFSWNGESEGDFVSCTVSKEVQDIRSVVHHFTQESYEILSIIWHSMWGVSSLVYQSKYWTSKTVINIAGLLDQWPETIELYTPEEVSEMQKTGFIEKNVFWRVFPISWEYYQDRSSYGNIGNCIKTIFAPVLVVEWSVDEPYNVEDGEEMMKHLNKPSSYEEIMWADHFFSWKETELSKIILNWLSKW